MVFQIIQNFAALHPFIFHSILIIASLLVILKAADLLVLGITDYAKKLGLSDYLIGMIIISLAASLPELISSVMGLAAGESTIIFGTIFGSVIGLFTLVLGSIAVIGKEIKTNKKVLEKTGVITFFLFLLPILFMVNGTLSRIEGIILVVAYIGYNYYIYRREGKLGAIKKDVKLKRIKKDMFIAIGALLAIILAGRWLVFSSIEMSSLLGITPFIIALTVIAIGAQIPDFAVSIRAIKQKHNDVALGDIIGSSVVQLTLFLGIFAIITPLTMDLRIVSPAVIFAALGTGTALFFARNGVLTRKHGIILILMFITYMAIQISVL